MKGPVPTMFDMLIETAFSNPNLRGSRACGSPAYAGLVSVLAVTREPFLPEENARILQIAVDDQHVLAPTKRLGAHGNSCPPARLQGKVIASEDYRL